MQRQTGSLFRSCLAAYLRSSLQFAVLCDIMSALYVRYTAYQRSFCLETISLTLEAAVVINQKWICPHRLSSQLWKLYSREKTSFKERLLMLPLHVTPRATGLTQHWSRSVVLVRAALVLDCMHFGYTTPLNPLVHLLNKSKPTCKPA